MIGFEIYSELWRRSSRVIEATIYYPYMTRGSYAQPLSPVIRCDAVLQNYILGRVGCAAANVEPIAAIVV